ncbi:MAG: PIN domain-containing protein [Acidobacteria bacterium]|nr:PIN domain-containing protein [Acidobacteriota bacterium]
MRDLPDQSAKATAAVTTSKCYVTDVVVTETAFVLEKVYEAPRNDIAVSLKSFLLFPNLICNADLLTDVIDLYQKRQSLSIVDCYAAVEANVSGNQLITFDRKLLKHGGLHVIEP